MIDALATVLARAGKENASDVLLTTGKPPVLIVSGRMNQLGNEPLHAEATRAWVHSMLNSDQIAAFEESRELDFSVTHGELRFRGNAFFQRGAVGAALRLVPNHIPALFELGLPPIVEELAEKRQGLILTTGPTGHGKSTTQAAVIDHINQTRSEHIVTIEDPIEFLHQNNKCVIEQREVGSDTRSFPTALRHVLRQAPNVILVGEMRDLETISTALTAAETGHLVLATLHTNDAPQSIDRVIDVFPPHQQNQVRAQLSASLLAIVAQRLLPGLDGGRVLACEVLLNTSAVANLIREHKIAQIPGILEAGGKYGMITMDASIKKLYLEGFIGEDVARAAMKHPQKLH